jgi:hypothetical protein
MKTLARFVGKLPFSGKVLVRLLALLFFYSTTKISRWLIYICLMVFLALFILVHGAQVVFGLEVMYFTCPIWAKLYSGFYALANLCVVLTQIYISFRATHFLCKGRYSRVKRSIVYKWTLAEVVFMLVVTLGGNVAFLAIYIEYR